MPNTYSQIYIQIVFTVQGRQNLIKEENREELHKFITGIVSNRGQKLLAIYARSSSYFGWDKTKHFDFRFSERCKSRFIQVHQ